VGNRLRQIWPRTLSVISFFCVIFPLFHRVMSSGFGERVNGSKENKRRNAQPTHSEVPTKLESLQKTLLAPFNHKKADSARILSDCPCHVLLRFLSVDFLDFSNSGPCDNDSPSD